MTDPKDSDLALALRLSEVFENQGVEPVAARFDATHIHVELRDGRLISVPIAWHPFLSRIPSDEKENFELLPSGIWWEAVDEGLSIKSMMMGWNSKTPVTPHDQSERLTLSAGVPISDERDENSSFLEGACSPIDYRTRILDRIHESYEHGRRFHSSFKYDQFFAATDALFDVGDILHRAETGKWPADEVLGKLWLYGVLQALAVQQSAMKQILDCFSLPQLECTKTELKKINELRIAAVGHPHNHSDKYLSIKGNTYLSHRSHGSLTRFKIATYPQEGGHVVREFDVRELTVKQAIAINANLAQAWNAVKDNPEFDRPDK